MFRKLLVVPLMTGLQQFVGGISYFIAYFMTKLINNYHLYGQESYQDSSNQS